MLHVSELFLLTVSCGKKVSPGEIRLITLTKSLKTAEFWNIENLTVGNGLTSSLIPDVLLPHVKQP